MVSEEDIKILRRFIKDFKECKRYCKEFTSNVTSITREEYQALEKLLQGYKELKEKDEKRDWTINKIIMEYIPDYELISLVNRYKNESFIPRVEVEKILEDRKK